MVDQAQFDAMSTQDKESQKFVLTQYGEIAVRVRNMGGDGVPQPWDASGGTLPTVVVAVPQWFVITVAGVLPVIGAVEPSDYILWSGTVWTFIENVAMQTLSYNSSTKNLTISGKNTVNISNLITNATVITNITTAGNWTGESYTGPLTNLVEGNYYTTGSFEYVFDGTTLSRIYIGFTPENIANKSNDIATDAASTIKYPSVKAIKDYVDLLVAGLLNYRGTYDASGNVRPSSGGSGIAGVPMKGDCWVISVPGTLGGTAIQIGDMVIAKVNTPGQTTDNRETLNTNFGYTPEDSANKTTSILSTSTDVQYPSTKSVYDLSQLKAIQFPGISAETPIGAQDISIDYTTRILTITPPLGYFHLYTDGSGAVTKIVKTGNVSFPAFTDTSGIRYFYFDSTGTAVTTQTPWTTFDNIASVYRILWNATLSGSAKSVGEAWECHQNTVPGIDHQWKHTFGTIYVSGFNIVDNKITTGSPNADGRNTCISITTGANMDDNLQYTITNSTGGLIWQQDLGNTNAGALTSTNSALFNVRSQDGGGLVSNITATRFPFAYSAGNVPQYINAVGTRTDVTNSNFFVYYVYSIQDPRNGQALKAVSATTQFTSLTNAQASSWSDIQAVYTTLNDGEIRPLYKLIYEYRSAYDVACKSSALRQVVDIRKQQITQLSVLAGSVLGTSVQITPSGTISSTNAQDAVIELDTEKVPYTGATGNVNLGAYNIATNNVVEGYTTTATAAGTTTLTVTSTFQQYFTGSAAQTVLLPVTSTLVLGHQYTITNLSTGLVTVQSSGANPVVILAAGTSAVFTCILTSGTTAASWSYAYSAVTVATGKKATINNNITFAGTDGTTMTFPSTTATLARIDAANTFVGVQTMTSPSITTSIVTASTSFLAWNTVATTLSAFGAATTMNIGGTPTTTLTHNYSANASASGQTKTINIGTGGVAGSTTAINIGAQASATTATINGKLLIAKGVTTDFDCEKITASYNNYIQENIQNTSNGASASSDHVATADTGNETTNFIDMGINSSAYSDAAFTITGALDSYLYSNGGHLAIGTATASKNLRFHTGGTLLANLRATLSDSAFNLASGVAYQINGVALKDVAETLTNKRDTKRVYSTTSTATLTPEVDTYSAFTLTAQAAGLTIANHSTSTPTDFEQIKIRILDNGTPQSIAFGTNYVARGGIDLPTTTVASKYTELLFEWVSAISKYNLLSLSQEA